MLNFFTILYTREIIIVTVTKTVQIKQSANGEPTLLVHCLY